MENESTNKSLAIYHFLEEQLQLFGEHFDATRDTINIESIHQMRVAIKRIRTIRKLKKHIHFPSVLSDEQYVKLKAFFAVSGQMRDLQVQQKLLVAYVGGLKYGFEDLAVYLDGIESSITAQLNAAIQSFDINQFYNPDQSPDLQNQLNNGIDLKTESVAFLHLKINKINGLLLLIDRDEFVHDLRKQVKQLFFILQFLKIHFPDCEFGNYNLRALKDIGEQLGNWNDREVFKKRLGEFLNSKGETYNETHPQYKLLLHQLEDDKQKVLENVDVKLREECGNVAMIQCGNATMIK